MFKSINLMIPNGLVNLQIIISQNINILWALISDTVYKL